MTSVTKTERVHKTLQKLKQLYPDAHCALIHETPFQLLIATMLSAQTTDEKVNQLTPALFQSYPDAKALSKADPHKVEPLIREINYYKTKSRHLVETAKLLVSLHGGQVPRSMEELVQLPGVGRKTANVVLGNAFGIASGVVVDTHVGRLSRRLGWTHHVDPVKVDSALQRLVPKQDWILVSHLLIYHGRQVCLARSAHCESCKLSSLCLRRI